MKYQKITRVIASSAKFVIATMSLLGIMGIARADLSVIDLGTAIATNRLSDNKINNSVISGKNICLSGGRPGYDCTDSTSLAAGICLSGGRPSYDCTDSTSLAAGICLSGGRPSYDCTNSTSLAAGICLSGGRPSYDCTASTSLPAGICLSTGRPSYECSSNLTMAEGLCLAKGQPTYICSSVSINAALNIEIIDLAWAWDKFYDEKASEQWRCRGRSTGKFADDAECANKDKLDNTWPSMRL